MTEATKLPQINSKVLGFTAKEIRKIVESKPGSHFLYRVGGVVAGYFTGETGNGEWTGFRGLFVAQKSDGTVYEANAAFFPAQIAAQLRERLEAGGEEIEVSADIFAAESDKNAAGFSYMCEPIISDTGRAKLDKLKGKLTGQALPIALEAPKASSTTADAKGTA